MNKHDIEYLNLCEKVLLFGEEHPDRTNTGVKSLFAEKLTFDMTSGFPILTTKKMYWRGIVSELLWFLSGSTNCNDLPEKVRHWWSPWADVNGDLGPIYGQNLRRWKTTDLCSANPDLGLVNSNMYFKEVDQITELIENIKNNPHSRRHVITTWNVAELSKMALPPCHGVATQFYVHNDGGLSCFTFQRSADVFIGLPVNISSYSLLLSIIAKLTNLTPKTLTISLGNAHIYSNHVEQVKEQLTRTPHPAPTLSIDESMNDIDNLNIDMFKLENYVSHSAIKGEVAV